MDKELDIRERGLNALRSEHVIEQRLVRERRGMLERARDRAFAAFGDASAAESALLTERELECRVLASIADVDDKLAHVARHRRLLASGKMCR